MQGVQVGPSHFEQKRLWTELGPLSFARVLVLMIAASVAATNATLMAKGTANIGVTRFSEITGCGKCMAFADTHTAPGGYIMGNVATAVSTNTITADRQKNDPSQRASM